LRLALLWCLILLAPLLQPHAAPRTALAAGHRVNWARIYAREARRASAAASRSTQSARLEAGHHRQEALARDARLQGRVSRHVMTSGGLAVDGRSDAQELRQYRLSHRQRPAVRAASNDPCITGWTCTDITWPWPGDGAVDNGGGSWTLTGNGSGTGGGTDSTFYMWQNATATTTFSARLASINQAPTYTEIGVMFRQSTDPSAPYYYLMVEPGVGVHLRYRLYPGAGTTTINGPTGGTAPIYLRITRTGFTFTASTSSDGSAYTPISGSTVAINMAPTTAGLDLDGSGGPTPAIATFDSVSLTSSGSDAAPGCPGGWSCQDVGTPTVAGTQSTVNPQTWALTASGYVNGSSDSFHSASQPLSASGTISARVMSLAAAEPGTQAGLMIRQSTDPGAAYYYAYLSTNGSLTVKYRVEQGRGGTVMVNQPGPGGYPYLKVERAGTTFKTYTSTDGQSWTELTAARIPVAIHGSALVGMALASSDGTPTTAEFDAVTVTPTDGTSIDQCPSGWSCQDVLETGDGWAGDQASVGGSSWAVAGGGDSIGGQYDGFRFDYQPIGSYGTVRATVWHLYQPISYTKAGVMLRQSTDPKDLYYYARVGQDAGGNISVAAEWRTNYNGYANASSSISITLPVSVEVQQAGNTFTAYYRPGGTGAWQPIPGSTATVNIGNALGGLATTSGVYGGVTTAGYNGVLLWRGGPGSSELGSPSEYCTTCPATSQPVDGANGEFWHTFGDLAIPGRGIPLDLTHSYRSINAGQNGPLGFGWTDSYNLYLTTDANGDVTVHEETGTQVTFYPDGSSYVAPSRVLASLVSNPDGTLTFTRFQTQQKLVFAAPTLSAAGMLQKEVDLNGYATSLSYSNGTLSSVTDPAGRALTFSYNTAGRLASVSDPAGRSVSFAYDSSGNLTDVIDLGGGHTHFTYDSNHLLLIVQKPNQYPAGPGLTNVYDSSQRVTQQIDPLNRISRISYTTNPDGSQTTTVTSPNGNVSTQLYNADTMLQSLTLGSGTPQAATWSFRYDPVTLGLSQVTDPNGHTVKNQWDAQGNLLQTTDGVLRTTAYSYNSFNEPLSVQDPENVLTQLQYDPSGNLLTVARPLTGSTYTGLSPYQTSVLSHSPYLYWTFDELVQLGPNTPPV
jgi:YD repeat-containing protein